MVTPLIRSMLSGLALALLVLGGAGCESTSGSAVATRRGVGEGEMFEVKAEYTPFYRNGPQQRGGPDVSLTRHRLVKMLKRGFGYSLVELEDGTPGYVSTEDLRPSAASDFAGADSGLFGLAPEPLTSSAIVERYTIDPSRPEPGFQLQPNGTVPGESLLPPDAPLPGVPEPAPAASPSPTPATP